MVVGTVPGSSTAEKFGAIKTVDPNYFLGGFYLDTNGGTQTLSNYYEEATVTGIGLSAGLAGGTTSLKFIRRDNYVHCFINLSVTATAAACTLGATGNPIPARFSPTTNTQTFAIVVTNTNYAVWVGTITSAGLMTIGTSGAASPGNAAAAAFVACTTVGWNRAQ
jgi:hypothetical protein